MASEMGERFTGRFHRGRKQSVRVEVAVRPFWSVATYWTVSIKFSVHKGLLTMDVVFELINHEFLITNYAFDKIPD
jgi:hypothetical protein